VTKAEKIFKEIIRDSGGGGQNLEREIADGFTKKCPFTFFSKIVDDIIGWASFENRENVFWG